MGQPLRNTKRLSQRAGRPLSLRFELLEVRDMLAAADLSGWVGVGKHFVAEQLHLEQHFSWRRVR